MPATDRLRREQQFHDRQARDRAVTFAALPGRLRFRDADYLDHEPWVRPAIDRLGNVCDKPVLDFGCGHGMAAVVLARRGAVVTACDLSAGYVAEARALLAPMKPSSVVSRPMATGCRLPMGVSPRSGDMRSFIISTL